MRRFRAPALIVAATLLVAATTAGGYLLGAAGRADEAAAISAKQEATSAAFARADLESMASGLVRGVGQGRADGAERAADEGWADGSADGQRLAAKRSGTLVADRGGSEPSLGPLNGDGGVLVVGDSLEVLTSPYIEQYLKQQGIDVTVNAVGGYNSYQIYDLFEESYDPSQSVIVFDAGTNDNPSYPEILAGNLDKVAARVGNRCMVVPTIHSIVVDGVGDRGKNRVVADFAASRPGTQTPDWSAAAAEHPDLLQPDDLHPTPEGSDYRAQLIVAGVQACLNGDPGSALLP